MKYWIKWIAVAALVASVGGHWAVLQGLAWTTMLARFAQSMPMTQAVAFTFDGRHPCQLCLAVQHGQQAEKERPKQIVSEKLLLFLDLQTIALPTVPPPGPPVWTLDTAHARLERPPYPPPRAV